MNCPAYKPGPAKFTTQKPTMPGLRGGLTSYVLCMSHYGMAISS
ncbi:hypothetical protein APS_1466 [Acetobacter pasteurianus subsp. pasteurianus LMG 1262 = NBRC 106471]|nr:hypothetical protein APS_1466 [Acetobacter pasteurianus subsp. pasteurianus LMG 1262 = NBRC 106471]